MVCTSPLIYSKFIVDVIYGFAIGFPYTDKGIRIKFRANAIQWMQMTNRLQSDDDEEDFEEDDD